MNEETDEILTCQAFEVHELIPWILKWNSSHMMSDHWLWRWHDRISRGQTKELTKDDSDSYAIKQLRLLPQLFDFFLMKVDLAMKSIHGIRARSRWNSGSPDMTDSVVSDVMLHVMARIWLDCRKTDVCYGFSQTEIWSRKAISTNSFVHSLDKEECQEFAFFLEALDRIIRIRWCYLELLKLVRTQNVSIYESIFI
jgi:hypothetical protein